jgi:magnesium-transporting ATPase (P-type)
MTSEVVLDGKSYIFIKGASEYILDSCDRIHFWDTDEVTNLTEDIKKEIRDNIHLFATKTLRTLCMAYKDKGSY